MAEYILFKKKREDDENDYSDEEGADGQRVRMNYKEIEPRELQLNRDNFLAYEQGSDDDDDNNERDGDNSDTDNNEQMRWEEEQIRKGIQISQVIISSNCE